MTCRHTQVRCSAWRGWFMIVLFMAGLFTIMVLMIVPFMAVLFGFVCA